MYFHKTSLMFSIKQKHISDCAGGSWKSACEKVLILNVQRLKAFYGMPFLFLLLLFVKIHLIIFLLSAGAAFGALPIRFQTSHFPGESAKLPLPN